MDVNGFTSKAAALRVLHANGHKFTGLLTAPESNPKVAKNGKIIGVFTAPLHLAPYDLSGFNVCPQASKGCISACLHTAGNPAYMSGKDASRKDKTKAYFTNREAFMAVLFFEIAAHARKSVSMGMECGVRLNATSDLPWELRTVTLDGKTVKLMEWFNAVSFYDYTKVTKRALQCATGKFPSNYSLTFSKTEANDDDCRKVLEAGGNVAAVVSLPLYKSAMATGRLPFPYESFPATDGDAHDYRPADPLGSIVVLKAKGLARKDTSGFVIR